MYVFLIVTFNFLLIEIFAASYYFIYFVFLVLYIFFFNTNTNYYIVTTVLALVTATIYFLQNYIFEFFLYFGIFKYYIYVEIEIFVALSIIHIVLLKYVSYYFDLKKMGYNLIKN